MEETKLDFRLKVHASKFMWITDNYIWVSNLDIFWWIIGAATDLFWADTFHNIFLEKSSDVRDDLLFVVRWNAREV